MLIHAAPAQAILESLVSPAGVLDFLSHCSKRKQQGAAVFGGSSSISCFFCFGFLFALRGCGKLEGGVWARAGGPSLDVQMGFEAIYMWKAERALAYAKYSIATNSIR